MNFSDYKYKTELHAHTSPVSSCSQIPPEDVVRNYAELGYSSIVISNHMHDHICYYGDKEKTMEYFLSDYKKACEYGKKYGINVILGCEIRFRENMNDYLLFGINEEILRDAYDFIPTDIETFSKWFRSDTRVLIQAHPFRDKMTMVPPRLLDGIESFNLHPSHNSRIGMASRYAQEHNLIVTCGTDYHHPNHQGMAAMLTKEPVTDSMVLAKILKSRDYLFQTGQAIVLPYGA